MDNRISIIPKYLICIDEAFCGRISGRLYCGCMSSGKVFCGIEELILTIDKIMDKVGYPQSTVDKREFGSKPKAEVIKSDRETLAAMRRFDTSTQKGKKETFVLQVQFRQNASWQGTIEGSGMPEGIEFKSALELIKIFDKVCEADSLVL